LRNAHLGAYGGTAIIERATKRKHFHRAAGVLQQRFAIAGDQRIVKSAAEALALLRRGFTRIAAEHQQGGIVGVETLQHNIVDDLVQGIAVTGKLVPPRFDRLVEALGDLLDDGYGLVDRPCRHMNRQGKQAGNEQLSHTHRFTS